MRLSLRLGLILTIAFMLVIVVLAGVLFTLRGSRAYGVSLPLPAQTAAIVALVEETPPDRIPLVIRALSTPELSINIVDAMPASQGTIPMPGMNLALHAYMIAMNGRPMTAMVSLEQSDAPASLRLGDNEARANRPIRFAIRMHTGKVLVLEARGALAERFTGIRIAIIALLATLAIGVATLWILNRQLRPLQSLSAAVERFGTRLETSNLPEEGTVELRNLTAAFNRLQSEITALIAARTRMLAAISHDLGTYLTRLRLRIEYISDPEQRERAARNIADMHALMTDTLALARLDQDSEIAESADLAELAEHSAQRFRQGGGDVTVHVAARPLPVRVRPAIFARVFDNLLSNALKYGHSAEISLTRAGDAAEILVEDRGAGIPAEERNAVLEPFYRRDSARNLDQGGFGLGLAIVADIVKRHAGTLSLEDRPGGGLRVRVRVPLVSED